MTSTADLGRALAALRPRATYTCEVCGELFEAWVRTKQVPSTCSPKCRQKAFRDRKKAR